MSTGFNQITDLYSIYNTVQNTMIRYPKELIIGTLKEYFAQDSRYHYVTDAWGFALTPDHTGLHPEAGLHDNVTTRVYIGEKFRYDIQYYPCILVSNTRVKSEPIGFSRDIHQIKYETFEYTDGYETRTFQRPVALTPNGAWSGSMEISIMSEGVREREDLIELTCMLLEDYEWSSLYRAGVSIKPGSISVGGVNAQDNRNGKIFQSTISFEYRSEWSREIPVYNFVDVISICAEMGNLQVTPPIIDPNLDIQIKIELEEKLLQ